MNFERRMAVILVLLAGCADLERGPRPPVPDAAPDVAPAEVGTAADAGLAFASVFPLIDGACKRCHMPGGMAADSKFLLTGMAATDYATVRALVDPAAAAGSRLLAKATGQGHGGGVVYRTSSTEYAALLAWIQGGAAP
jgi:mono/diheme cytochrome c family protein